MAGHRTVPLAVIACIALLPCVGPPVAQAHGQPPDLTFWGPFEAPTLRCLLVLGSATQRCFRQVLAAERPCIEAQLVGGTCDAPGRTASIDAAKQVASRVVADMCSVSELADLLFISIDEAQVAVTQACVDQVDAALSLFYGPTAGNGLVTAVGPGVGQCMVAISTLSERFLGIALRQRTRFLSRLAAVPLGPSQKKAAMSRLHASAAAVGEKMTERMRDACPAFEAFYARTTMNFVGELVARAECLVAATYLQTAILCPPPFCGNGIKEPGEECEDGNWVDDDGCRNDCTLPR